MNINSDDIEEFSKHFKRNIETMINDGCFTQAKNFISEYEMIRKNDIELFSFKGIIELAEGNYEEAEALFSEGLKFNPQDTHLLYNLAYLYELKQEHINSYRCYKRIGDSAELALKNSVSEKLKELSEIPRVQKYKERKKVLIIAYIFPPLGGSGVQRTLKFVKYLREFGWEPVVLTVIGENGTLLDQSLMSEIPEEIEIIRISENVDVNLRYVNELVEIYQKVVNNDELMVQYVASLNQNPKLVSKLALLPDPAIVFAKEALRVIDERVNLEEIDIIYSTSGPYADHLLGYMLKLKYQKRWVVDFRDEWTNNPYYDYNRDDLIFKMFREMEQNILTKSDKILAITPYAKTNYINDFGIPESKIITLTNGYDEEDFKQLDSSLFKNKNKRFRIMHNGLMYMIRTPETFFQAISNLVKKNAIPKGRIEVLLTQTDDDVKWMKLACDLDIEGVARFLGYLEHAESLEYASKSDLLLLIVGPGERNKAVYTGKIFEYLRIGKPIISLSPKGSLVEELLVNCQRGENYDFYDIEKIEKYILEMYKLWETDNYPVMKVDETIRQFERERLTHRLSEVFNELL